ncbi:MAG: hypothetical protein H6858_09280 [Rhodospirillales bacterium]|nr:hypothetical protein [Alphaproteobacteria bacterium]MCB9977776.1 hypothetical protein [Rhodospirillales bacterium]
MALLTAIAAGSYLPLIVTAGVYLRALGTRYPLQIFKDTIGRLGGQVTAAAFILVLPALFLLFFEQPAFMDLPWDQEQTALTVLIWVMEYPLTLLLYHGVLAKLQKEDRLYEPASSMREMLGLDLLKHGFLTVLFFASLVAGNQTFHIDKAVAFKKTIEQVLVAAF